jgi:hypothetical protein
LPAGHKARAHPDRASPDLAAGQLGDDITVQAFKVEALLAEWLAVTRQLPIVVNLRV